MSNSQRSYISRRLVQSLNLTPISRIKFGLNVFNSPENVVVDCPQYKIDDKTRFGKKQLIVCEIENICNPLSTNVSSAKLRSMFNKVENIHFADNYKSNADLQIDIL